MDLDEQFDANDEDVLSSSYQGGENGSGRAARQPHVIQLPLTRVKNIIKSDPDMGLAGQEAVLLIAKATELFIGYVARQSHVHTVQAKRKTVQRRDLDACIPIHDELTFLDGALE
ncbi:hypothetical protein EMCRGX_G029458 [Ephydatia muelleri]